MIKRYILKNIETLLTEGFTSDELRQFCFYELEFKPVYDQVAEVTNKAVITQKLVEYAIQKLQMDTLLDWTKEHNLVRYEQHQPYYHDFTTDSTRDSNVHEGSQRARSGILNTLEEKDWNTLLQRINKGKCTPFLGAEACANVLPLSDIAREWVQKFDYPPLEGVTDLAQVAQYLAIEYYPIFPKEEFQQRLANIKPPNFTDPDEPHRVLADLPLPIYITTNYDNFMVQALKSRGKEPKREWCRWKKELFEGRRPLKLDPTSNHPVVFHLHGHNEAPASLVLTEDDYLEFLANISKDADLLPPRIREALTGASLLFLGYRITDWDFRVLVRTVASYLKGNIYSGAHISVQVEPEDKFTEIQKEKVQKYLSQYFEKLEIRVYWGSCHKFAAELRQRWEAFNRGP